MAHFDTLRENILKILSKYPVDTYNGTVPMSDTYKRYILEMEFLKNEKLNINKLGLKAMTEFAVSLDEVQAIINNAIREHFKLEDI